MTRPPDGLVLALDIGSSSTRAAFFDDRGQRILATTAARRYSLRYTADGGAELDARTLLRAAKACVQTTLRARETTDGLSKIPVIAVSGSAFWHGLLGLDRAGVPMTPIFTWADNRSAADAADLRREFREREVQLRTGCMLRAPFWPAKLLWLRRTDRALFRRVARWTSPAQWIFAQLFGAGSTSHSMASGTGLYDLNQRTWDAALGQRCHLKPEQLSDLDDAPNECHPGAKDLREAKIFSALGDGAASNLGSGADSPGRVAINIGTSAAVRMIAPATSKRARRIAPGLFSYVVDEARLVIGGAISNAGNLREWCLRELQVAGDPEKALSRRASANDALTILPYLVSERAPTWPESINGTIAGLTHATSAADIFRAATTATYYRLAEILDALASAAEPIQSVIVSGGVLKSKASLAILADSLARDITLCRELESSLRGAAIHALEELGYEIAPLARGRTIRHEPSLAAKHRTRRLRQAALERALV